MPCRNIEDRRTYQREWSRRKKAGIQTRTTPILTEEERKISIKKSGIKYRDKRKKAIEKIFGKYCLTCNFERRERSFTIIHRKDGTEHTRITLLSITDIEKMKINGEKEKYVNLCGRCHKSVHWCMKYLGMTWEEIEKRYNRTIENKEGIVPDKGVV